MPNEYADYLYLKESELRLEFENKPQTRENDSIRAKKLFAIQDSYLDRFQSNENVFMLPKIAQIMYDELHHHNNHLYDLLAFTVMPNHIHLLIIPLEKEPGDVYSIADIMNLIKGRSSRYINNELKRSGKLWLREYYDHYVRDENELNNVIQYIVMNPVKAGLVNEPGLWRWTYVKDTSGSWNLSFVK